MNKARVFDYYSKFSLRDLQRFWRKVVIKEGCWQWTASKNDKEYGTFWLKNGMISAHRAVLLFTGHYLPQDMLVDHKCRNKACVNPTHLRIVTSKINSIENNDGPTAVNAAKTHCVRGHELIKENLTGLNGRRCKKCSAMWASIYLKRNKKKKALQKYREACGDKCGDSAKNK